MTAGPPRRTMAVLAMRAFHGLLLGAFLSALLAVSVVAQPQTVFRADTRLVEVSVVVQDRAGHPVEGLTREDFTVLDDGREQPIELFSVEGAVHPTAPASSAATVSGEFTNHLEGRAAGAVTVVLFDRLNTGLDAQRPSRAQVIQALSRIRPEDRVALYVLDPTAMRVLHDFTNDSTALIRAFSGTGGLEAPQLDTLEASELGPLKAFLLGAAQDMSDVVVFNRVEATADALATVANRLAGVHGRRNLVWISSSFPLVYKGHFGTELMQPAVDRAVRAANDGNVAIYPVDARGLIVNMAEPVTTTTGPSTFQMPRGRSDLPVESSGRPPVIPSRTVDFDAMKSLAADTGGRAFFNSNDIAGALHGAREDSGLSYVLGYYPSHGKWNGAFRQITVWVNRKDVVVRHRRGYLALPLRPAATPAAGDVLLDEARSPLQSTGLGLTARRVGSDTGGAGNAADVTLAIHVDPAGITLVKSGEAWAFSLALAIAQRHPDGDFTKGVVGSVDVEVPASRHDQVVASGFMFNRTIALDPAADELHLVLRDSASGATGSLVIPAAALR